MDVQAVQETMKGQKVSVNGTLYTVDADGIARGLKDEDAKKLLTMTKCWRAPVVRKAVTPVAVAPVPKVTAPVPAPVVEEKADGEEWPDPTEEMALDYLQKMADAYDVKYDQKTSKAKLVKAIHKAMYQ